VQSAPDNNQAAGQIADLEKRYAALRQAAVLPAADLSAVLDAAFTELEGAIGMLVGLAAAGAGSNGSGGPDSSERRLLRAIFQEAPVPLFTLALDGTVLRVNRAAGDLLGAKQGYATGRMFSAFVTLAGRAAVQTQLTAVARNRHARRVRCDLLGPSGPVSAELVIGFVSVSGDAEQLVVAVAAEPAAAASAEPGARPSTARPPRSGKKPAARKPAEPDGTRKPAEPDGTGEASGAVAAITQRMDLVTAVTRLLLQNENFNESMTLQRCARLLAGEMASWVILDMERGERLRRQFVIGPDGPEYAVISAAAAGVNPGRGSLPQQVHESGQPALIAHAEEADILGRGPDGIPLLMMLGATSVLSVPLADGNDRYGVLTLARQAREGHFEIADLALVEELGEQLALAIRVDHMFRRNTEIADTLQASLLPRTLPDIPGADIAAVYLAATEGVDIGADFYDVYPAASGWGLSVGDVRGKGEEAAAITAAARHAIRVLAHDGATPAAVLAAANGILLSQQLDGGFVTTSLAHLYADDAGIRVALGSAGHPAPVVIRSDGQVQTVGGGGLPLGLFADAEPGLQDATLAAGDVLFLYTDGITQARSSDRTFFSERLHDELARLAGRHPDDIVSAMRTALLDFTERRLADDIAMVVLRVR
jgi:serine phosphatase RsbU (regulator of sigma subunit)/PAS domain-containing protein